VVVAVAGKHNHTGVRLDRQQSPRRLQAVDARQFGDGRGFGEVCGSPATRRA
jgi:hypothetical protein